MVHTVELDATRTIHYSFRVVHRTTVSTLKAQKAADFIISHCPNIGSFYGDSSPHEFIREAASLIHAAEHTDLFPQRYKEHVVLALEMVGTYEWLTPPSAIASVYLARRFEFYFRILSGVLKRDGTWISTTAEATAKHAMPSIQKKAKRISSVSTAYKLMKLEPTSLANYCRNLDAILYPASNKSKIKDIGDRIAWTRHRAGHGEWGDISSEAVFYGLMTALVFFCNHKP